MGGSRHRTSMKLIIVALFCLARPGAFANNLNGDLLASTLLSLDEDVLMTDVVTLNIERDGIADIHRSNSEFVAKTNDDLVPKVAGEEDLQTGRRRRRQTKSRPMTKKECKKFAKRGVMEWSGGKCNLTSKTKKAIVRVMMPKRKASHGAKWEVKGNCKDKNGQGWLRTGNIPVKCSNRLGTVMCPCHSSNGKALTVAQAGEKIKAELAKIQDRSMHPVSKAINTQKKAFALHFMKACWSRLCKASQLSEMDLSWGGGSSC